MRFHRNRCRPASSSRRAGSRRYLTAALATWFVIAIGGCGDAESPEDSGSPSPTRYEWSALGDDEPIDRREPSRVALAYAQRVFRRDGSHREFEHPDVNDDVRRYVYLDDPPPVDQATPIPETIKIQSVGGRGSGSMAGLPVFAHRRPGIISGTNSVATVVELALGYPDGTWKGVEVALRPLELVETENGPSFAIHPDWAVVPPPERPR